MHPSESRNYTRQNNHFFALEGGTFQGQIQEAVGDDLMRMREDLRDR
jgi:hypothetical protein